MKNAIKFITALFLLFISTTQIFAKDIHPKKNNYLILSTNIQQLQPILLTAKELTKEDGKKMGEFHVIFCGKTVKDMADATKFTALLDEAKAAGVKVFVCGLSLQQFSVSKESLPANLELTQNGILHALQHQKKGFITLSI